MERIFRRLCLVSLVFFFAGCGGGGGGGGGNASDTNFTVLQVSEFAVVYSFEETTGVTAFNGIFDDAHGQIVGAARTEGKVGGALDLSQHPEANVHLLPWPLNSHGLEFTFPDGNLAVGGWFRPTALQPEPSYQIFGGSGSGLQSFALKIDRGFLKLFVFQDSRNPVTVATSSTSLPNGEWTHIAATYDGTVGKIYINGALDSTTSISMPLSDVYNDLYLSFPGVVDEFFFAGLPLSAQDIQGIFLDTEPTLPDVTHLSPPSSPLLMLQDGTSYGPTAHFAMDEATGTFVANSEFPALEGTLSGGAHTSGLIGNAIDFSPLSTAHVQLSIGDSNAPVGFVPGHLTFSRDNLTIATWLYPDHLAPAGTYHLFGDGYSGIQSIKLILQDGFVELLVNADYLGHHSNRLVVRSNTRLTNGDWTQVAVTYDTNHATLYIDGVPDAVSNLVIPIPDIVNIPYLGGLPTVPGSAFPGLMDEFYLSTEVFTPQQIMALSQP